MTATAPARAKAIADMEYARKTHAEWAEFLRANPDWKGDEHVPDPSAMVGSPEEEDEWVAKYDNVLAVLRGDA